MNRCADIIVTYNRIELLKENIQALLNQSFQEHDILIIDNASTDGTKEMVLSLNNPKIKYFNTEKNLGGAGGFSFGIKKAVEMGYKYGWIMDDDSIPDKDALAMLIKKAEYLNNDFSFLASLVYWIDEKIFPMNFPSLDVKHISDFDYRSISEYNSLPISGCSFVGCFVNLDVSRKVGLPIKEFFIYGDDIEYTHRLRTEKPAYLVTKSTILHKAPSNKGADIATAGADRIDRFYLQSRNGMYIARKEKKKLQCLHTVFSRVVNVIKYAPDNKIKRLWVLAKGTISGLFFNPKIEHFDK